MLTPVEIENRLERILLKVQKPGRYVGGELNSVVKDWSKHAIKVALVFPDIYDLGVSNLGLQILYEIINHHPGALAERAYIPWVDMEAEMRAAGIPLYSLETKHSLAEFDLIGFSLPYESLYTNALNALDLAGIPLLSSNRSGNHPLVIAGGHACFNPEPMHAFMDAFVIGEGEEVIEDILNSIAGSAHNFSAPQDDHRTPDRASMLRNLARIAGVYVPSLYRTSYHGDGTVSGISPITTDIPNVVIKRICAQMPPPPTRLIVPNIGTVHERASVEIMRGCTRGCRFCHAGMVTRPVRERTVNEILDAAGKMIRSTGFEELAFLSLSSSDYSRITDLVHAVNKRFKNQKLSISLPSLRIETVSVDLMDALKSHRASGFTLAPEAATEHMRRIINKFIPDEQLISTVREIYARGWTTIKLYFMIGHPSETLDDVLAISNLCKRILSEGRQSLGGRARVHAGIGTFVPKPHTPFQWAACDTVNQIEAKQLLLQKELRDRSIKLSWTDPRDTLMEAWLSRGDRRMAEVIHAAWKYGAKMDAWGDQHRPEAWAAAFNQNGMDPEFYTHRLRQPDEILPWDHISAGVHKSYLQQDFQSSLEGETREDCREKCFACGILPTFNDLRRKNPGQHWKCPEVKGNGA